MTTDTAAGVRMRPMMEGVQADLEAHLNALRRKRERAKMRGQPIEPIEVRIRHQEQLLRRLRLYSQPENAGVKS